MLDIEFTVEDGELFFLQVRSAKRSALAAVRTAVALVHDGWISRSEALSRVRPEQLDVLGRPHLADADGIDALATGLAASPGIAIGAICLSTERVLDLADLGEAAILVREETSPDDVAGMAISEGIVTAKGGLVSHAAVVARGLSIPAVVGVDTIRIDLDAGRVRFGTEILREGDVITIDGGSGTIAAHALRVEPPAESGELDEFLSWADEIAAVDAGAASPVQRLVTAQRAIAADSKIAAK
jgi:pyruvate,orthophosphate dikinase